MNLVKRRTFEGSGVGGREGITKVVMRGGGI